MSRTWAMGLAAALLVVACGESEQDDEVAPACNGVSPADLVSESTQAGQCPQDPTTLTGQATVGQQCSDATDCAPTCCACPGTNEGADVAECNNGNCLDGSTACCLFALQCGQ